MSKSIKIIIAFRAIASRGVCYHENIGLDQHKHLDGMVQMCNAHSIASLAFQPQVNLLYVRLRD